MTKYLWEDEEVTAVRYDPWDRMYLLECDSYAYPQWVESDDPRLQILTR